MQEQQLRANSETEIKARVQQEIKAREQAEMEAEAKYRQEAAARAKAAAEERRKREEESKGAAAPVRAKKATNWPVTIGVLLLVLVGGVIGVLEAVPLNNYIGSAQEALGKRLGVPVTISNLRYSLLRQQLTLERVGIGKLGEIKVGSITANALPTVFFGSSKTFNDVEVNSVNIDQDQLGMVPGWVKPASADQAVHVRRMRLKSVKLALRGLDIELFNADVLFGADGALQRAVLTDGKLKVELAPKDKAMRIAVEARNWKAPLGPAVEFEDLTAEGVIDGQQVVFQAIDGKLGFAPLKATARGSWGTGAIQVEGEFNATKVDLSQMMAPFTRDFSATGSLNTNGTYALQGESLQSLFAEPKVEANFSIEGGTLNNVDLVRAIQSPSRDGQRGGNTRFNTLAGSMQLSGKAYRYRQLQLSSGPMNATGNVEVAAGGDLSGRVSAELGTKTYIVAKGTLTVTGNLKSPLLRP